MKRDLNPDVINQRLLARWHWILITAIVGGLIGWGITFLRTPQYQATAVLEIGIDYGRTLPLDDNAERHAFDRVRELLVSDVVLKDVMDNLKEQADISESISTISQLRERIRLEDKGNRWEISVVAGMPQEAALMANTWAQRALLELERAVQHAWKAGELQTKLFNVGCQLEVLEDQEQEVVWNCERIKPEYDPDDLLDTLLQEISLSHGIIPALSFSLVRYAEVPTDTVIWGRGGIILSLTIVGFLLGCMYASFREAPLDR